MVKILIASLVLLIMVTSCSVKNYDKVYTLSSNIETRWSTLENPGGLKGKGGMTNKGAKGRAYISLKAGESHALLDIEGSGIINRIWLTTGAFLGPEGLDKQARKVMFRALKVDMYWDGEKKPAVSSPLGDFFGFGSGLPVSFESFFFASPEGRSANCFIPMPFRKSARIVITNESESATVLFYEVNYTMGIKHASNTGYFHAFWNTNLRDKKLGEDYVLLPKVAGKGRYLGAHINVIADTAMYKRTWFGEGEVKIYLNGDKDYPTLVGTGAEDYVGTGWGLGFYSQLYQGSLFASQEVNYKYSFYRLHVPDPVFFKQDCRVTIQMMGSAEQKDVKKVISGGANLKVVSAVIDQFNEKSNFIPFLDDTIGVRDIRSKEFENSGVCFYRVDDYSSVVYFYLNRPTNELPSLQDVATRTAKID